MADGGQAAAAPAGAKTPADFLKSIKGKAVIVKLNSGVDYRGEPGERRDSDPPARLLHRRRCCRRRRRLPTLASRPLSVQACWPASTAT